MDRLLDYLKSVKYDIGVDCFTKTNLPHIKPETLKLSVSIPMSHPFFSEEEYQGKLVSIVSSLSQSVVKTILKYIFNSGEKSFIDLTNQFENASSRRKTIFAKIYNDITQKYLVSCSRISSDYFMDYSAFLNLPFNGKISSMNLMYPVGSIQLGTKREVWVDPYMRWSDNYVLCFDSIKIDISNFLFSIPNYSLAPKVEISLDLRFEVINPVVFFIYEDDYMENWSEYKQEVRDKKINYILDENKESESNSQFGFHLNNKLES